MNRSLTSGPRRIARRASAALICLMLSGCFARGLPNVTNYQLPALLDLTPPPLRSPLAVGIVSAAEPFDGSRLAYQTSPWRLDTYTYNRWVAPPTELVRDQLVRYIDRQSPQPASSIKPVVMLNARILAFQEVDNGATRSGLVSIEFCLSGDDPTRAPRWCMLCRHENPATGEGLDPVVAAINTSLNQAISELNTQLAGRMGTAATAASLTPSS